MSYCAKADLVERFSVRELAQLTDETAAQSPDDAEIAKWCDEASSLVDSYVGTRYDVPLSPVPTIVRKWACDIARKFLWKDRAGKDSVVALNYAEALKQLGDVATGKASLPDSTGTQAAGPGGIAYARPTAVFNTDGLL